MNLSVIYPLNETLLYSTKTMNDVLYKGYYHNRESMHGNSPPHKQKTNGDDSLNLSCFPFILQKQPTTIDFDETPIIVTFAVCHSAASRRL